VLFQTCHPVFCNTLRLPVNTAEFVLCLAALLECSVTATFSFVVKYTTTHFVVVYAARVMTDIEQEIRELHRAWKEAPEGSKQEALAKAEYQRLSALQLESSKLTNAGKHARDDDDVAEPPLKKTRTGVWSEKHLDEDTVCCVICHACFKEWHLCKVSIGCPTV